MQYTIEARELTGQSSHRATGEAESRRTVDAVDAEEAISRYVRDRAMELVSLSRPGRGSESIATVKRKDTVYLVRIYEA